MFGGLREEEEGVGGGGGSGSGRSFYGIKGGLK